MFTNFWSLILFQDSSEGQYDSVTVVSTKYMYIFIGIEASFHVDQPKLSCVFPQERPSRDDEVTANIYSIPEGVSITESLMKLCSVYMYMYMYIKF